MSLDEIRARVAAATPGPWRAHPDGLVWADRPGDPVSGSTETEDAEFIAHAITDVPALLADVERLAAFEAKAENLADTLNAVRRLCQSYTPEPPLLFRGPGLSEHGVGFNAGTRTLAEAVLGVLTDSALTGVSGPGLSLAELLVLHEWDELVFGGFICLKCTPDDAAIPEENVYWPCPPLREAGLTDEQARDVVLRHRAVIEARARGEATLAPEGGAS